MSFAMFVVVGLSVGVVLYGIALDRIRMGLPLALLIGLVAAFAGGLIGAAVAGDPVTRIGTATAGGTAIGGYLSVALIAVLAHRRQGLPSRQRMQPVHRPRNPLGNDFR